MPHTHTYCTNDMTRNIQHLNFICDLHICIKSGYSLRVTKRSPNIFFLQYLMFFQVKCYPLLPRSVGISIHINLI